MKLYIDQDNYKNSYIIPEDRKDYCNFECNGITLLTGLNGAGKTDFFNGIKHLIPTNYEYKNRHNVTAKFNDDIYKITIDKCFKFGNRNRLFYIQFPETGLHQKLQAGLMDLFIDTLYTQGHGDIYIGDIYILETHSESMFTRLRVRIKQGAIDKNRVHIYWFEKGMNFQEIKIDKNGELDPYPKGFFDQLTNDLMELI